jgi:redox-sensitive bicupin YhaK (pirin superfamily)
MITIRRSADRGHASHGWLDSYHTFSFADYHDPRFMNFGVLRVLNQDRVTPGQGFGTHGHRDMEIVSYVLEGTLEHKDSLGTGSQMRPGDVQLMSAGTGVMHSEFNPSRTESLHFLQMWVLPRKLRTRPRYEQKAFPAAGRRAQLRLVVSPDGRDGSLTIGQDARLHAALIGAGDRVPHELAEGRSAWLHVARGRVALNGQALGAGDGAGLVGERAFELGGVDEAEVVLWDLPAE